MQTAPRPAVGRLRRHLAFDEGRSLHITSSKPSVESARKPLDATVDAALDLLCETYPKCFVRYEARRQPLKLGIDRDLLAALDGAVTAHELGRALRIYTANRVYRRRLRAGAVRIDLAGNPAGIVTAEQAFPYPDRKNRGRVRGPEKGEVHV